jgi:hypothetical protein
MIPQTGTVLCIEVKATACSSRCEVLRSAGYTAVLASPGEAAKLLVDRTFDIVVTVGLSDLELTQVCDADRSATVFPIPDRTTPTLFLFLVDER